ncbi:MAG: hypothetical protein WKF88_10200 [Ferruginibacter sp.]
MKNNLFDSHVKEQLGGYRPEVPPHIWENILAEKSRKKPIGFWSRLSGLQIAAVLVFLAGGAGFIYFVNNSKPATVNPVSSSVTVSPSNGTNPASANGGPTENTLPDKNAANKNNDAYLNNNVVTQPASQQISVTPGSTAVFIPSETFRNKANQPYRAGVNPVTSETTSLEEGNIPSAPLNKYSGLAVLKNSMRFEPGLWTPFRSVNLSIPCPTAEKDASGNKRYVEIYAGPDYVFNDLTDPALSTYLQQRRASTNLLFAFSAGIRYTKVFGSGMSIRSGLNYSRVNEAFKSVKGHVTQNVYITNTAGDTTGTYTVSGTQYNERTNTYRTIDIPVVVGYEFGNGRLHANLNAGAMINISSRKTGYVLDTNGNAVDISSGKQPSIYSYKTKAGVSLTGGLSVYYKLNEQLHVMAEPYFRYSLSPITQSALSLKQKYHTAGLRLGVRVDL